MDTRLTKWKVRAVGGTAVLAAVLWIGVGTAAADPTGPVTELTCEGTTYETVVAGNGNWTPAHDSDSNVMFIPTWFGDFHGTVLDAQGNVVDDFVEEGDSPRAKVPRGRVTFSSARSASSRCPTAPIRNSLRATASSVGAMSRFSPRPAPEDLPLIEKAA